MSGAYLYGIRLGRSVVVVPKSPLDEIVFILHLFSIKYNRVSLLLPFECEIE
jgi:hypothetical protein